MTSEGSHLDERVPLVEFDKFLIGCPDRQEGTKVAVMIFIGSVTV
jgi:hypothetical protein